MNKFSALLFVAATSFPLLGHCWNPFGSSEEKEISSFEEALQTCDSDPSACHKAMHRACKDGHRMACDSLGKFTSEKAQSATERCFKYRDPSGCDEALIWHQHSCEYGFTQHCRDAQEMARIFNKGSTSLAPPEYPKPYGGSYPQYPTAGYGVPQTGYSYPQYPTPYTGGHSVYDPPRSAWDIPEFRDNRIKRLFSLPLLDDDDE